MTMPFDTYGMSARMRALKDEEDRRRELQIALGNPQSDTIQETVDKVGYGPFNPTVDPNKSGPPEWGGVFPQQVVDQQISLMPSGAFSGPTPAQVAANLRAQEEARLLQSARTTYAPSLADSTTAMSYAPTIDYESAEEAQRRRERAAQMEAMELDARLRAQQQETAARESGGFGSMQYGTSADRPGLFTPDTPAPTPQEQLASLQEAETLKNTLASAVFGDIGKWNSFVSTTDFGYESGPLRALESIGITKEMMRSQDPEVLRNMIQQIIDTNILADPGFDTASTLFSNIPFGETPESNRLKRALDTNQRLQELLSGTPSASGPNIVDSAQMAVDAAGGGPATTSTTPAQSMSPADIAAQTQYTGDVTPSANIAQQQTVSANAGDIFNQAYDALALLRSGSTGSRLPVGIFAIAQEEAENGNLNGPANQLVTAFNAEQAGLTPFGEDTRARAEFDAQQREAERAFQTTERTGTQDFTTSEREGTQDFVTGERLGAEAFTTSEREATEGFVTSERVATQTWQAGESQKQRDLESDIAEGLNETNITINQVATEANKYIAEQNNLTERDIALFNNNTAKEVAEITGLNQGKVEDIKGEWARIVAMQTGSDQISIQNIIQNATNQRKAEELLSAERISNAQIASAKALQEIIGGDQLALVEAQNTAALNVANANNTSAEAIAALQGDDAFSLAEMQISNQFANEKEISAIQKEYQKELATLTGTTEEQIAGINNAANKELEDARIAGNKAAYEAQIASAETISTAQLESAEGIAKEARDLQVSESALDRATQEAIAKTQYLNDLQPAEFATLQKDIARGGLSVEESENLAALVARGGLTAEQRLAEMSAESRTDEMNAFLALLSNPSALGAFVTAISGELPFEAVPTMSQLSDMTPNRIQYLQGALSALGIDPQTFIRMAQDVTPQAFQETGPFGQISAMIA
tara:strand:+ start:5461 stop:8280 length:2820 start_codon:yes stop_codon:yes gene_type:complete